MLVFPVCLYVLLGQQAPGQPISWYVLQDVRPCRKPAQFLFRVLITAVALQFIVTTMNLVANHITMFNSFVALADRPNALMEIVLYWTLKVPTPVKISQVCSVMNVSHEPWDVWVIRSE